MKKQQCFYCGTKNVELKERCRKCGRHLVEIR
jgi:ribosomal protein L40E